LKTIADLNGVDFLRTVNAIRTQAAAPLKKLKVMETLRTQPILTGEETAEEKKAKLAEQSKKNLETLTERILNDEPEATIELLNLLIIQEEGEELKGLDYILAGMELISNQKVVNFLLSLMKSGLLNTEN
jgi:hypothetical protein